MNGLWPFPVLLQIIYVIWSIFLAVLPAVPRDVAGAHKPSLLCGRERDGRDVSERSGSNRLDASNRQSERGSKKSSVRGGTNSSSHRRKDRVQGEGRKKKDSAGGDERKKKSLPTSSSHRDKKHSHSKHKSRKKMMILRLSEKG